MVISFQINVEMDRDPAPGSADAEAVIAEAAQKILDGLNEDNFFEIVDSAKIETRPGQQQDGFCIK